MALDTKLGFNLHLKSVQCIVNKTVLLRKLQNILPRRSLIYKSFIRPHLNYGDIFMIEHTILCFIKILNQFNQCRISNYGRNRRNFKRKNILRIRFWIFPRKTSKTLLLIQNNQKQVTKSLFLISSFIKYQIFNQKLQKYPPNLYKT